MRSWLWWNLGPLLALGSGVMNFFFFFSCPSLFVPIPLIFGSFPHQCTLESTARTACLFVCASGVFDLCSGVIANSISSFALSNPAFFFYPIFHGAAGAARCSNYFFFQVQYLLS